MIRVSIAARKADVVPILLACLIWLPALIGSGAFVLSLHADAGPLRVLQRLALSGLLGLLVMSVLGTAGNFFIAVYPILPTAGLVVGWAICFSQRRELFSGIQRGHFATALALLTAISVSASRGKIEYDTGLYHLTAVRWITSMPTPFGLANLYGRLGFNSAWFVTAAMLQTPLLLGKSTFILNALLFVFVGLLIVDAGKHIFQHGFNRADAFLALAAYPCALYGLQYSSSLYPDLAVMLLICLVTSLWLSGNYSGWAIPMAVTLAIFAVTLKLSAIPLLIAAIAALIWQRMRGTSVVLLLAWGAILGVWFIRGIILTGCLLYPSTPTRINRLSWAVPAARIDVESTCIRDWAQYHRLPWEITRGQPWFWDWLKDTMENQSMLVANGIFLTGALILGMHGKVPPRHQFIWIILANAVGIIYWFLTAPALRFGYGYIFSFAAVFFCLGLETLQLSDLRRKQLCWAGVIIVTLLSGFFQKLNHITWLNWPKIPSTALATHQITENLILNVPRTGDEIWDSPLTATPYPDPALRCITNRRGQFRRFWLDPSQKPLPVP